MISKCAASYSAKMHSLDERIWGFISMVSSHWTIIFLMISKFKGKGEEGLTFQINNSAVACFWKLLLHVQPFITLIYLHFVLVPASSREPKRGKSRGSMLQIMNVFGKQIIQKYASCLCHPLFCIHTEIFVIQGKHSKYDYRFTNLNAVGGKE